MTEGPIAPLLTIWVTSVTDNIDHAVTDDEMVSGPGSYTAVCGTTGSQPHWLTRQVDTAPPAWHSCEPEPIATILSSAKPPVLLTANVNIATASPAGFLDSRQRCRP